MTLTDIAIGMLFGAALCVDGWGCSARAEGAQPDQCVVSKSDGYMVSIAPDECIIVEADGTEHRAANVGDNCLFVFTDGSRVEIWRDAENMFIRGGSTTAYLGLCD